MTRAIVVGGGLAGLAAAHGLLDNGVTVTLLEAELAPGGLARTTREGGFCFDWGPHAMSLPPGEEAAQLLAASGTEAQLVDALPQARRRLLYVDGKLHPLNPRGLPGLLGARGLARLLLEPLIPGRQDDSESFAGFIRRRLGPRAAEVLAQPLITGIYGGDAEEIGARDGLPNFAKLEPRFGGIVVGALRNRRRAKAHGKARICAPRDGFGALAEGLAARVQQRGATLRLGVRVTGLAAEGAGFRVLAGGETLAADRVVLAGSHTLAAGLVRSLAPGAAAELDGIEAASMVSVGLGYAAASLPAPPSAYGFIAVDRIEALACVFESSVFPARAPDGHVLLRVMLGGRQEPEAVHAPEAELVARARAALARVLGIHDAPVAHWIARMSDGLPQYLPGHARRIARIRAALPPGILLAGQSYDGVGTAPAMTGALRAVAGVR